MELNPKNITQDQYRKKQNLINIKSIENLRYLYPNGHRTNHQMRWFKFCRERDLSSKTAL